MKQKLLKTMLLLCALVVGSGTMWADDPITIASFSNGSQSGWTTSGSWSGTSYFYLTYNTSYIETPSITWDDYTNITITITARKYGGPDTTQGKISVRTSGGDTDLASYSPSSTGLVASSALSISPTGTGKLKIACFGASSNKGCGVSQIVIKGELATTAEATKIVIDASDVENNIFGDNTDGGTLTATVKDSSDEPIVAAAVTWSSSDETVASINSDGEITLKKVGSTTITASYAGITDVYQSSSKTYTLNVINEDPDIVEIWSEDFSDYKANDVPSGGTYSYACTNGKTNTKIYDASLAGGTSPEILISNGGGTLTATIPLLYPTYGYDGDLTLTFKTNNTNVAVSTSTVGVTVTGSIVAGTSTLTLSGVTTATENVVITFTNSESSNVRLDDIVLKGKQAELSVVATPSISPASGTIVSGTEVTMTCATDGATIYYTTDGSTPTSSSTAYNPASKPSITSACTINAIGIKDGLTDSEVASATYTIAEPCATPTFSMAGGEVAKGTSVTISCDTDGATIYYTTNGSTPTTSSSVYSSALTINTNQTIKAIAVKDGNANSEVASATYTVIDYTTLPFDYDGNGLGELPTGLTQSGLTEKYNSSPKMKFDTTGDYLILKTNAAHDKLLLKYDILGNGFSGGTFKVQYSADGSSYTDLKSYTSLGAKVSETFAEIPVSTLYIKWIYTNKSSGNVALGNIKLSGYENITIGSAGYTTYTTDDKVTMPDGVTAYIATAINTSTIHLDEVENVPADEPIILKADAGTYYLPIITTDTDDVSENILESSDGSVTSDASNIVYALAKKSSVVGFYKVSSTITVPEGKAYFKVATGGGSVKEFYPFEEDDATAIENVNGNYNLNNGAIYNISGQRLQKLQKGINIVNGKKVLF